MSGQLQDQTALVIGGAGGIGQAIAAAFEAEGALVTIADRAEALAQAAGTTVPIDVTDSDSVRCAVDATEQRYGHIDVLVNAAGVSSERYWDELGIDEWERIISINLTGTFLVCKEVVPRMVRRKRGRVINIASQLAIKGAPGLAHYCASKAGVIGLTKALALEVAPQGVLVNAIAPGPIHTPLTDRMSEGWKRQKADELPLKRFGIPEEVAPTAVLLASEIGGSLYVGQTLGPNSGDVMP
ncbi:SDR family NAD(P)-dependent oxidoreductase [Arthrobacter ginkgonis]|uniref:SDR family NAD(P)-dependent oxidoreductase n=1 Tax=Arthrobacter ginkgonis TaxID=1630594 RepID=UPI0031E8A5D3